MKALLKRLPELLLVGAVRCYQAWISPLLGPTCRFTPTCSQYAIEAVRKYGVLRGGWKATWRIVRCNPFVRGGYDPP
ncbi:membrane protein insertion efficiency factor YidD [Alienimonas chondri]|uniref:Putative membrane protein insertion efficiency factor n=1 Tax=Alienimonas chondri TaxID=2681879 RepID=A0ABX1VJS1_9PLAN|nr:membrane protein insertion efficiency factor YidD [Alienimonas chondri]NNJ27710.1 putative membrane protein insertion efficiency factor [Alienimonas chondri]